MHLESERLQKAGYRIIGRHSAVKVCHWTKKSLLDRGVCYKEEFYGRELGIKSHLCLQMTPALWFCDHKCVHCWRDTRVTSSVWEGEPDDPSLILDLAIRAQRELLSGFGGNPVVNRKKFEEAKNPKHCAISLAGEPTFYPKIAELIEECAKRGMTSFLVSNGMHPKVLEKIPSPSQLYISVLAPNEELYRRLCSPLIQDGWNRLLQSLDVLRSFKGRTAIRITLIRGMNMDDPAAYAPLVIRAEPDFVEVKGYMWVGYSRSRLKLENMPSHADVTSFASELSSATGYRISGEQPASRVVLLKR
ncbi:MAG: 4-demethylwyosine synthase TYW1 [Candidatus Hadarchaeales archaeon]